MMEGKKIGFYVKFSNVWNLADELLVFSLNFPMKNSLFICCTDLWHSAGNKKNFAPDFLTPLFNRFGVHII